MAVIFWKKIAMLNAASPGSDHGSDCQDSSITAFAEESNFIIYILYVLPIRIFSQKIKLISMNFQFRLFLLLFSRFDELNVRQSTNIMNQEMAWLIFRTNIFVQILKKKEVNKIKLLFRA